MLPAKGGQTHIRTRAKVASATAPATPLAPGRSPTQQKSLRASAAGTPPKSVVPSASGSRVSSHPDQSAGDTSFKTAGKSRGMVSGARNSIGSLSTASTSRSSSPASLHSTSPAVPCSSPAPTMSKQGSPSALSRSTPCAQIKDASVRGGKVGQAGEVGMRATSARASTSTTRRSFAASSKTATGVTAGALSLSGASSRTSTGKSLQPCLAQQPPRGFLRGTGRGCPSAPDKVGRRPQAGPSVQCEIRERQSGSEQQLSPVLPQQQHICLEQQELHNTIAEMREKESIMQQQLRIKDAQLQEIEHKLERAVRAHEEMREAYEQRLNYLRLSHSLSPSRMAGQQQTVGTVLPSFSSLSSSPMETDNPKAQDGLCPSHVLAQVKQQHSKTQVHAVKAGQVHRPSPEIQQQLPQQPLPGSEHVLLPQMETPVVVAIADSELESEVLTDSDGEKAKAQTIDGKVDTFTEAQTGKLHGILKAPVKEILFPPCDPEVVQLRQRIIQYYRDSKSTFISQSAADQVKTVPPDIVAQGERYVEAVYTQEHSHSYSPGYLTESLQEIQGNMSCTRALDLETVLCCIHQAKNAEYSQLSSEVGLNVTQAEAEECMPSPKRRAKSRQHKQCWVDERCAGDLVELRYFDRPFKSNAGVVMGSKDRCQVFGHADTDTFDEHAQNLYRLSFGQALKMLRKPRAMKTPPLCAKMSARNCKDDEGEQEHEQCPNDEEYDSEKRHQKGQAHEEAKVAAPVRAIDVTEFGIAAPEGYFETSLGASNESSTEDSSIDTAVRVKSDKHVKRCDFGATQKLIFDHSVVSAVRSLHSSASSGSLERTCELDSPNHDANSENCSDNDANNNSSSSDGASCLVQTAVAMSQTIGGFQPNGCQSTGIRSKRALDCSVPKLDAALFGRAE